MGFFSNIWKKITGTKTKPKLNYPTVEGIDVSHYQGPQDWKKLKASGIEFVFVNCTDGLSAPDKRYKDHVSGAQAAGLLVGSYHFFKPQLDPVQQARYFVQNAVLTELGYVCDWEISGGLSRGENINSALKFLREVEFLTGRIPIIYSGSAMLESLKLDASFSRFHLWIAHYKTNEPRVPKPWRRYDFWQWTEDYKGVSMDRNVFNGTRDQLKIFTKVIHLTNQL